MGKKPLEQIFCIIEDALEEPGEYWKIKEEVSYHADQILRLCDKLYELGDHSLKDIAGESNDY